MASNRIKSGLQVTDSDGSSAPDHGTMVSPGPVHAAPRGHPRRPQNHRFFVNMSPCEPKWRYLTEPMGTPTPHAMGAVGSNRFCVRGQLLFFNHTPALSFYLHSEKVVWRKKFVTHPKRHVARRPHRVRCWNGHRHGLGWPSQPDTLI